MQHSFIQSQIKDSIDVKERILNDAALIDVINTACDVIIGAYQNKNKTLIAGNGGSAADAQHIAAEFVNRFYYDRRGLPSISLSTDTSIITSIGNDYGYDQLFAKQVEAYGNKGDVFMGISTSGNSKNIIEALKLCKQNGIKTIGLTGAKGGQMDELCDICIKVPSTETPRIQESHILIGHIICCIVEDELFGGDKTKF